MDVHILAQTVAIYALPVLFAITLHEAAHGYVARHFGDMTAHAQGRVSLNPIRHIDLVGTILVTHAVLPNMFKRRAGHIINMSSVAGLIAAPLITTYSASKYGVRAFTDALRREVSPFGIKVSGIYPGPAATEFGKHLERTTAREQANRSMGGRMTSEYVAQCVVEIAKHPRRSLVIPWWFRILTTFETLCPVAVDWIFYFFTKRNHHLN